ncbi:HD domain-containing phosphohydrolase [Halomonas sp. HNIBRBA4712]|uniref:HD domain-containing phosphohydrolase n=1 Tax=Halomonas sp. HNIBRBA4712 TaxID=3373087 RepID=UPI0037456BCD
MEVEQDGFESVDDHASISDLLDLMIENGGVSLCLTTPNATPEPIVLMEQHPGEALVMDLSPVSYLLHRLQSGEPFFLRGQFEGKVIRTTALTLVQTRRSGGRFLCESDYPGALWVLQRRESFRAQLRLGMTVAVTVTNDQGQSAQGELRDLSQSGCQVELPLNASGILTQAHSPLRLAFTFPDGTSFAIDAEARHQQVDAEHHLLRVGFELVDHSAEQSRKIWYFVCEIEREAIRYDKEAEASARQASPLFTSQGIARSQQDQVGRRDLKHYATPAARRLVKVAAYLDAQLLLLTQGNDIDSRQLSLNADRIISLHEEDRQALLFASRCLSLEPELVRHGIAVAIQLLDWIGADLPPDARKAMVASALVHDLGKALIPQVVYTAPHFEASHLKVLSEHPGLLLERLKSCQWLSQSVAHAVIKGINERIDGSGYPDRLDGQAVGELSRACAIIDVVEAMRRDRPDRPATTTQQIYRYLLSHPEQFDPRWVKRYIDHFTALPVGTLVLFSSEQLAWIVRIDERGTPLEVVLTDQAAAPLRATLKYSVSGDVAERLGSPVRELAVST